MAIAVTNKRVDGLTFIEAVMLAGVGATSNGEWIDVRGKKFTVHIEGISTAVVQVRGSNSPAKPADNEHDVQIGADIAVDQMVFIDAPLCWVKVRISAWTSGTIYAWLAGVS